MKYITDDKGHKYYVDNFDYQEDSFKKQFRLSGVKKNSQIPAKWLDNTWKWHWVYEFIYEDGKCFYIEIDYNNKFLYLTKK